jgi:hypothetical protein
MFQIDDSFIIVNVSKEMFQTKVVEKITAHILRLVTFFSKNRAVCEIMSKNVVGSERQQTI